MSTVWIEIMNGLITLETFEQNMIDKNIVLVGVGKNAAKLILNRGWKVSYAVDNDITKQGKNNELGIAIHSVSYLKKHVYNEDTLFVITPWRYLDLLKQIEELGICDSSQVLIYNYMLALQWDIDRINANKKKPVVFSQGQQVIPKIIHFFWFSDDPFPDEVSKCIQSWKKFCPDYKIIKWNLNNYKTDNAFFNEAISQKCWAFASDFARCDVVYRYGGVYLDSDVELISSLDDLLCDEGFFCFESPVGVDPGSGFGGVQNNSIIGEICQQYETIHFINEDGSYNKISILNQFSSVLEKHGMVKTGEYQNIEGISIYPPLVMSPYSYMTGLTTVDNTTHGIHHWVSAWISEDEMTNMNYRKSYFANHEKEVRMIIENAIG